MIVQDGRLFPFERFTSVMNLTNVDAVLQQIGEGTIGEGDAAAAFRDFSIASLGDDTPAVELFDEQQLDRTFIDFYLPQQSLAIAGA